MKAKCYACDERIDIHNRCRKRACRVQLLRDHRPWWEDGPFVF